jgi:aspartate/methionine/tyrosine aminotransferase
MRPKISEKANKFKRIISPVGRIMMSADSNHIQSVGINPEELISFAGGWANHKAPKELQIAYEEIATNDDLFHKSGSYPPSTGNPEFKKAVIKFEKHVYGMNNLNVEQIAVGLGSTQLAMDLFEVILDPGDKILLLDPSYCNYPTQIMSRIPDASILRFPVLDDATWEYLPDSKINEFHEFILENKPKMILLISPDNPTSKILPDKFVAAGLEAAIQIGSFLVMDFAYKEIVFDGANPKYFSWEPNDNFISLRSNSKWCRGLGRRLGWIEAPDFVIESIESMQNSSILCPDMLHQLAMTEYINVATKNNTLIPYINDISKQYQTAAKQTVASINYNLGLPVLEPEGGLYTCIKIDIDGGKFVEDVLKETGVLLVPGWGFGKTVKNAVRISYGPLVNDIEKINIGLEKIAGYLNK